MAWALSNQNTCQMLNRKKKHVGWISLLDLMDSPSNVLALLIDLLLFFEAPESVFLHHLSDDSLFQSG